LPEGRRHVARVIARIIAATALAAVASLSQASGAAAAPAGPVAAAEAGIHAVLLRDERLLLLAREPLRHGLVLDLEARAEAGPGTLRVVLDGPDGTAAAVFDAGRIETGASPRRLQVGWDSETRRFVAGRPGAAPDVGMPVAADTIASVSLHVTGSLRITAGPLRQGGPRAHGHTALRDLLIGPGNAVSARWPDTAGAVRLVESGDLPVWQAQRDGVRLAHAAPLFLAASVDAPRVVVSFAARVIEGGCASVDLLDAEGRGMSFRAEPAGALGGTLIRLGWRRLDRGGGCTVGEPSADEPDAGDAVVVDGRVLSAGEPVRVSFEWDRLTGAVNVQAERSQAIPLEAASPGGESVRLALGLGTRGDAIGALTVGTVPADAIDVRAHGAVGDGLADDGPALRRALAAARAGGGLQAVYLPPGVHRIVARDDAGMLTLGGRGRGPVLIGAGHGSVLLGARREHVAVRLAGTAPVLARVRVLAADVRIRTSAPTRAAVNLVRGVQRPAVVDCELGPTEETALMSHFANAPLVTGNRVLGTMADGLHFTHATRGARVSDNLVRRTHDDAIAVVSYRSLEGRPVAVVSDVDIVDNDVGRNRLWGRGIAVVGGADVRIRRNRIVDTNAAGLLLAAEQHYDTAGVRDVVVEDNTIERPRVGDVPHAGVLLWADAGAPWRRIERIVLRRNTVDAAGWRGMTVGCGAADIDVEDNAITGSASLSMMITGTAGRVRVRGNTFDGAPGVVVLATATDTWCPEGASGTLEIVDNRIGRLSGPTPADDCDPSALVSVSGPPGRHWSGVRIEGNRFVSRRTRCAARPEAVSSTLPLDGDPCAMNRSDRLATVRVTDPSGLASTLCEVPAR
jgi:hypothetical protein